MNEKKTAYSNSRGKIARFGCEQKQIYPNRNGKHPKKAAANNDYYYVKVYKHFVMLIVASSLYFNYTELNSRFVLWCNISAGSAPLRNPPQTDIPFFFFWTI